MGDSKSEAVVETRSGHKAMPWQEWNATVLGPAVFEKFDMRNDEHRVIAGAIREIAASAFRAGHRYGFARATDPDLE